MQSLNLSMIHKAEILQYFDIVLKTFSIFPSKSQGYFNFTLSIRITPIKTKRAVKVVAWFEIN